LPHQLPVATPIHSYKGYKRRPPVKKSFLQERKRERKKKERKKERNKEIKKEKKNYASSKKLFASIKEKEPLGKKSPFTRKEKGGSVRIRMVASRQAGRPLLIGLKVGRMLKRTSGLDKLMSRVHRMSMEFEGKFLDSLWIKAETLQRNQSVRNVNNTPFT